MGNNKVYRHKSVKTDANSLLILNLGNDASQIGKHGADEVFCPCGSKKSASCEWATTGLYHVFQDYCYSSSGHALSILSAMKAIDLPVKIL